MTRVLILSPSPLVKAGLRALLQPFPQLEVVDGAFPGGALTAGAAPITPVDVILAEAENDEILPDDLASIPAQIPIILLARNPAAAWSAADHSRVRAVLPDRATGPQIAAATEAVAEGLSVLDAETAEQFAPARWARAVGDRPPEPLTARETEVLRALADGLANKQIAARFGVSENTVKFHVAAVMGKLGAGSRTEAVMLGVRLGIVLI